MARRKRSFRSASKAAPWEEDARWSDDDDSNKYADDDDDVYTARGWDAQVDALIAHRAKKVCNPAQIRSAMSLINNIRLGRSRAARKETLARSELLSWRF